MAEIRFSPAWVRALSCCSHVTCYANYCTAVSASGLGMLYFNRLSFLPPLSNFVVKQARLQFSFSHTFTTPPKNKNTKTANPQTPKKKRASCSRRKQQPPPDLPATDTKVPSTYDEEEPSLKSLMTLLGNISDRLAIREQRLGSLTAENNPSSQSFFTAQVAPSTSRTVDERGGDDRPPAGSPR